MGIYLGNLTIKEFEKRAGIELTDEERALFEEMREQVCEKVKGNKSIHIYDIPFCIECGNPEARKIVLDILTPYSSKIKEPLQVGGGVK